MSASERTDAPTVSVIVPCHDVELYVEECVRSALGQTFDDIEVIAVDDGSTDSTGALLASLASSDARLAVIVQENRGLGNARNTGVDAATGKFLLFLDSDDVLPTDALERMVRSAEESGADLVTGVAYQFDSNDRWRAAPYGPLFDEDRTGCHLSRDHELVYDQMACSKLFRTRFWHEQQLRFPEGVLYEDAALIMRAHWLASSVDIVSTECYRIRRRDVGAPSITQDRYRPGSAAARFTALRIADDYLRTTSPDVWAAHGTKICLVDLRLYARLVADSPDGWAQEFMRAAGPTLAAISPAAVRELNPAMKVLRRAVIEQNAGAVRRSADLLSGVAGRSLPSTVAGVVGLSTLHPGLVVNALRPERRQELDVDEKTTSPSTA